MREIKFRAWDKENNVMMNADYFGIDEYITPEGSVVEKETHSGIGFSDMYLVDISDKRILMQFTGLKDKNGREIYESDVVIRTIVAPSTTNEDFIGEVKFFEGRWWIDNGQDAVPLWSEADEIKIIGNIFENPELLEVNK